MIFSNIGDGGEGGEGGRDVGSWKDTRLGVVFALGVVATPFGIDEMTGGLGGVAFVST